MDIFAKAERGRGRESERERERESHGYILCMRKRIVDGVMRI
jgi:hypothetical protein